MGLGIIFLMWELGQPNKMFPQILKLAHFLLERGGFWNGASRLAVLGVGAAESRPSETHEMLKAKQSQRTPIQPPCFVAKTQRPREGK